MPHTRKVLRFLTPVALVAGLVLVPTGCSGDGGSPSPTAPESHTLVLSDAAVLVDGQPIPPGGTFHHNHGGVGGAPSTRFEARLTRQGRPAAGYRVEVRFERPTGMMHHAGRFFLYDDGTHGDLAAGDGLYCFEDAEGDYGFHHRGAAHGEYHYDFCGLYPDGAETNHQLCYLTVAD